MLILRTGPYGSGQVCPQLCQGSILRQTVRERDSPGGTQVCQVGRLFQILFLTGYFIQCHQGSHQSNCRLRIRILQDITATTGSKTDQCETVIVIFCRFTSDLQIIRIIYNSRRPMPGRPPPWHHWSYCKQRYRRILRPGNFPMSHVSSRY